MILCGRGDACEGLQAAHASAPFVMTFDDHEVSNDWAGDWNPDDVPPELFVLRRAAAFQAWYEHMPVRKAQLPRGPDIQAYRRFAVGDLITMNVLDTRQFRTPSACGSGRRYNCAEAFEPHRTMLGPTQDGTSISSQGDGSDMNESFRLRIAKQPYVKFFNGQRGYLRHIVTPRRWQADFQVIDKVTVPDGRMSTRKSLVVENGRSAIEGGVKTVVTCPFVTTFQTPPRAWPVFFHCCTFPDAVYGLNRR